MKEKLGVIESLEIKVSQIILALIIILVFISASGRWVGYPIVWSNDIAQLLFVWACFLGGDLALRKDGHIGVDMLTKGFSERVQKIITICNYILMIIFLSIIFYHGIKLSIDNYKRMYNTIAISYSWAVMSAPVGCILMISTIIKKIKKLIFN